MRNHPLHTIAMRVASVATIAILLAASHGPSIRPVCANERDTIGKTHAPAADTAKRAFIREIRRSLRAIDERLSALGKRVLDVPGFYARLSDQLVNMQVEVSAARASYLKAKLAREIAEIAIREYKEGILVQDEMSVEGEITLAHSDLMRAREMVEFGDQIGVPNELKIETRLNEQGKASTLEAAQWKKKRLIEYTAPRQVKELESDVAKTRSNELVKKAEWERLQRRAEKIQNALTAGRGGTDVERRSLALLDQATQVDTRVHAKLDQLVKMADSDDLLQKEIRDLTNELGTIIDEAEAARAADEFASLKSGIRDAARRKGAAPR